jgi:hypothetical protein
VLALFFFARGRLRTLGGASCACYSGDYSKHNPALALAGRNKPAGAVHARFQRLNAEFFGCIFLKN